MQQLQQLHTSSSRTLAWYHQFPSHGPPSKGSTDVLGTFTGAVRIGHTSSRTSRIELTSGTWPGTANPAAGSNSAAAAATGASTDEEMPSQASPTVSDRSFFASREQLQAMVPKEPPREVRRQRPAGGGPQLQLDFTAGTSSGTNSDCPRSGAITPPTPPPQAMEHSQ